MHTLISVNTSCPHDLTTMMTLLVEQGGIKTLFRRDIVGR